MSHLPYLPELPRSVRLALWLAHSSAALGEAKRFRAAIEDDDEPHRLLDPSGVHRQIVAAALPELSADAPALLADAVALWVHPDVRAAALLPVSGDARGLQPALAEPALEAEECLYVSVGGVHGALVPDVEEFGSHLEPGYIVTWTLIPASDWENPFVGAVGTLAEAERELRVGLRTATEALHGLDVAKWRPDLADAIGALSAGISDHWDLPDSLSQRQVHVLSLAARLRLIVQLATEDDGGAINLWQADQRSTALRNVDHAARRAMSAATYSPIR